MEILVPAAGLSTRYPNMRPKYLLYDYKSDIMVKNAVKQFISDQHNIVIGVLLEHDKKYHSIEHIAHAIPNAVIHVLDEVTKGPADTIYQMLKALGDDDIPFLVKDCDSFFEHDVLPGNYVCVSNIRNHETLRKLSSKSFVKCNDQGIITDIIEKEVVSDTFCVGGYKFESSHQYIKTYEKLAGQVGEIYVSHIIQDMLMNGKTFSISEVRDYVDVGTIEEWTEFNNKPVVFCDVDGTLIQSQGRFGKYTYYDDPIPLENNFKLIKKMYDEGAQIIFTTAREAQYHDVTQSMLKKLGFENCLLISGLNISTRILINDYNDANPYPRAIAYNPKRDKDDLKDFIR